MAQEYQIATPEAVDISYDVAGIGSRFVAAALDLLIAVGLFILVTLGSVGLMQLPEPGPTVGVILLLTLSFLLFWGYFVLFETFWSGQTPGKRITHIRVIKMSGHPIGFLEALIRNLVRFVDFLPSMYALGVVVMFISSRSRRLGDLAAGTLVVKERQRIPASALRSPSAPQSQVPPLGTIDPEEIQWDLRALSAPDLQIIDDYLARSPRFSPEVRQRVGTEVAEMVAEKIGARRPLDPGPFLRRVRDLAE
jgi:uncharacterized RDD family membrane protein YckC